MMSVMVVRRCLLLVNLGKYEAYSDSKYRFAVKKKSSKVSYKILLLSDSTFFKLFFPHIRRYY